MNDKIIWRGTEQDAADMINAFSKHCECDQEHQKLCASHRAMDNEQRFVDGLLYGRAIRAKLLKEEGIQTSSN